MDKRVRTTMAVTAVALCGAALAAPPAVAVDSVTCTTGEEPHAGRQFTLSARTEPITGEFTYRWDLDGDGSFETDTGSESTVRTERATAGTFIFGVAVTDGEAPAGDGRREARGTCAVTVVNDVPIPNFEMHPVEETFPTAYEALRFTYSGSDGEDGLNQRPLTHAIDFDADGRFEFTTQGAGEVYASFPAGFDKTVTHRITDAAGASVDTRIAVKAASSPFGIGGSAVIAPLSVGPLPAVKASAPRSVKRRTLLKRGVVANFTWGATWGRVTVIPAVKLGRKTTSAFSFSGDAGYAPGQRLAIRPLPPQLKALVRRGAKTLQLRWTAKGQEGAEQKGRLVVRITR